MFIASNPQDQNNLRLEQEITELQRALLQTSGARIDINFLPALPFEDFEQQIAIFKPDLLHISAHGTKEHLFLASSKENSVPLTEETLRALIASHPPTLLLISACTSTSIAKAIIDTVPYAVGISEPVTIFAARKSIVSLYRVLLRGESIRAAFNTANATLKALSSTPTTSGEGSASIEATLAVAPGRSPENERLYSLPRLVARFKSNNFPKTAETFGFVVGICGAYPNTNQVVFATDEETFIKDGKFPYSEMSTVVRTTPVDGEIWMTELLEPIYGDFNLFALATTTDGGCYSVSAKLCDALRNYYDVYFQEDGAANYPDDLQRILELLMRNNGAEMRPRSMRPVVASKRPKLLNDAANKPADKARLLARRKIR